VGTSPEDSVAAISLAEKYENIFAAVGIHPEEADNYDSVDSLKPLLDSSKLLAIGETGLDYHYNSAGRENQRKLFLAHLKLAGKHGLPVVVHCREAFEDTISIIRSGTEYVRGVFHCFSGDLDQAGQAIELGWFISFSGIVTFKNAELLRRVVLNLPLDRIMIETDCPFLSPEPVRKIRLNEPAYLVHTARFMANLLNKPFNEFVLLMYENATRFFGRRIKIKKDENE